ncbi:MAG: EAL domain-containing protein [Hungatella hathewayi]|nr:EAL domain-containing protein [Hungatella hathewayi]
MLAHKVILVVEDNEINRTLLVTLLSEEYRVLEAENGQAALDVLKEHGEEIALILLDITMPVMDGYTFLSIIREEPAFSAIPVIVTTQSDSEEDEVSALSHGATDFVAKPYKPQIILHRVASIIRLRETAAMINQFQYDRLTGVYSREFFYQRVRESLQQAPRKTYDIICSNIENFKLLNDVFGTVVGDQLLCGIADLYREFVGNHGIVGRLNADQFVCLLEGGRTYADEMFIRAGEAVNALPNGKNVVMKWGIYSITDYDTSVEQMCDRALLAARSIKGQYGKYFAAYDDKLRGELLRRQAILDCMETALAEEQFFVCLQPKYRVIDSALAGAESLVRWRHPEWGIQSPAEFIPIFEQNGFITKLDQFVWEKTCYYLRQWEDMGYPVIPVSVNVSRADIYNTDIADILMDILKKYRLSPERLHLEITESAYTENPNQIIETVSRLRGLGFIIEMDDFGTGYSSLNMLNRMPIDILKLDMKFIQGEAKRTAKHGILRFIMDLARWMGLSVVAEGVETKEQLDQLMDIGCDYAQGYYFSKPVTCDVFEHLLKEEKIVGITELKNRKPQENQRLLAADENAAYRKQIRETFDGVFEVLEAEDADAVQRVVSEMGDDLAAVILSATLPGVERLGEPAEPGREKVGWKVPIIVTGAQDSGLEEKALALGAADFAGKPHSQKSLFQRVLRAIKLTTFQKQEQLLEREAFRDHMTDTLNRRGWDMAVSTLRREDLPYALYLFDLDNLKQINDTFGHMEGDRLIEGFSQILRTHTRDSDIISRYGGDEFVVIMKQMGSEEVALRKGEEICRAFKEAVFSNGTRGRVSVGVTITRGKESMEEVFKRVDEAMYQAKSSHRGHAFCGGTDSDGE